MFILRRLLPATGHYYAMLPMDIYGSHPGLPQKRRPWFVVSLLIFVASVVFNIIFVVKYLWRAPRPLDDYQHL